MQRHVLVNEKIKTYKIYLADFIVILSISFTFFLLTATVNIKSDYKFSDKVKNVGFEIEPEELESINQSHDIRKLDLREGIKRFTIFVMSSALSLRSILDAHKLTGPNYADWLRNLRIVLRVEKLEYVFDSPKPTEPASDAHNDEHVVYRKWIDDANVAQCIMLPSMNIELQKQHEHMDAHTILMHLQELYDVVGRTARYEISKELFGCRMSEGSSVNDHVLKMINLIERLEQLGFAMDGELSQDLVLQSLPEKKKNPSKKKKVGEKRSVPPKAEDSKSKAVCFHCNKVGQWKRNRKVYLAELKKKKGSETTASVSDRGGEYLNGEFLAYLKENGIISQWTPSYTPQLNGLSERRNRTLLDMVWSMMSYANLPVFLWGYALETSAYLLNKVPSKSIPQTPYEIWKERKPSLKHVKIWGCPAYVKKVDPDKLKSRSHIRRTGRVSRQPERYYGLVIENDNELSIIDDDDPMTYNEAMSSVDSEK
ncbi:hypothetical protein AgCh_007768 [Apium graveolens]